MAKENINKIKIGIIGATGYTGAELYRILSNRDDCEIVYVHSSTMAGEPYLNSYEHLQSRLILGDKQPDEIFEICDVVFTALPHGASVIYGEAAHKSGKKMIDLGADYRFKDISIYEQWYKVPHEGQVSLEHSMYIIPELHREELLRVRENISVIGNPGCYTTSVQLGVGPFLKKGLIKGNTIIANCNSGISGAGRSLSTKVHFSEINESMEAYGTGTHRHKPEIEYHLGALIDHKEEVKVLFAPHLVPMTRGIHSTIYVDLKDEFQQMGEDDLRDVLEDFYRDEKFVRILRKGVFPKTKWAYGSNFCFLNLILDKDTGKLVIFSVIDNVGKGAAQQGVQNMNLLLGIQEDLGIAMEPIFP